MDAQVLRRWVWRLLARRRRNRIRLQSVRNNSSGNRTTLAIVIAAAELCVDQAGIGVPGYLGSWSRRVHLESCVCVVVQTDIVRLT